MTIIIRYREIQISSFESTQIKSHQVRFVFVLLCLIFVSFAVSYCVFSCSAHSSSVQFNAIQCSSVQCSSMRGHAMLPKSFQPKSLSFKSGKFIPFLVCSVLLEICSALLRCALPCRPGLCRAIMYCAAMSCTVLCCVLLYCDVPGVGLFSSLELSSESNRVESISGGGVCG
jgi:hypothetical protein